MASTLSASEVFAWNAMITPTAQGSRVLARTAAGYMFLLHSMRVKSWRGIKLLDDTLRAQSGERNISTPRHPRKTH